MNRWTVMLRASTLFVIFTVLGFLVVTWLRGG